MDFNAFPALRKLGYAPCSACRYYAYGGTGTDPVTCVNHYHHPACPVVGVAKRRGFSVRPWYLSSALSGPSLGFDPSDGYDTQASARGARAGDVYSAALESGKDTGKTYLSGKAVDTLRGWGITDEQIKVIVEVAGKSPDQIVAEGKEAALAKVKDAAALIKGYATVKLNEAAVSGMKELGFSQAEAEALAATGGSVDKLKALGKAKLGDLVSDLNVRLKKEGIDIAGSAAKSLGISQKDLGVAVAAASAAYDIFTSVNDALSARPAYSRGMWSDGFFQGDDSLRELTHTLDNLAVQSEEARASKSLKTRKVVDSIAKGVAIIPVYGWIAAAGIEVVAELATSLGWTKASSDANGPEFSDRAKVYSDRLWKEYGFAPPAFDSAAYSIQSYADDALAYSLGLLDEAEAERPFKEIWRKCVVWSMNQPVGRPHPAIADLLSKGWIPLQFSEWMGGALSPLMSNAPSGSAKWSGVDGLAFCAGCDAGLTGPPADVTAGMGMVASMRERLDPLYAAEVWRDFGIAFRVLPHQSRENMGLNPASFSTPPIGVIFTSPRSIELQTLVRNRMAVAIGTILAAINRVSIEAPIEAAVQRNREWIEAYGFAPQHSAKAFRDVFFAAAVAAGKSPHIVHLPGGDIDLSTMVAHKIETPALSGVKVSLEGIRGLR